MKQKHRHTLLLIACLTLTMILTLTAYGCSSKEKANTTAAADSQTTTLQTKAGMVSEQTTATTSAADMSGSIPELADMKSLSSYRYTIKTSLKEGVGAGFEDTMKYEWVRDQKAEHAWREDAKGEVTETYISIGDKTWMWLPQMGWIEQEPMPASESSIPSDLADQLEKAQQEIENSKMRFEKTGSETVNGINCIKYEFDYYLTMEMPDMVNGGTTKTEMHNFGNMWIADEANLPAVVIRSVSTTEMNADNVKTEMVSEQNLSDIGSEIQIDPPDDVMQIPSMPVLPS